MNSGSFIAFSSSKCIGFVGVSGAIFCLTFLRFWRVDADNTPSKKNPIYRPSTAELSTETIKNSTMTYYPHNALAPYCIIVVVTIKLRGVEAVHMDQKLEHYDPRDTESVPEAGVFEEEVDRG